MAIKILFISNAIPGCTIEQDHRRIKRRIRSMLDFKSSDRKIAISKPVARLWSFAARVKVLDLIRVSPYRPAASRRPQKEGLTEVCVRSQAQGEETSCTEGGNHRSRPLVARAQGRREGAARAGVFMRARLFSERVSAGLSGSTLGETIAVAVHFEDADMRSTWWVIRSSSAPVRCSDPRVSVHSPNGRLLVIRVAPPFVALRDQLKQQFRAGLGERHEAQLIDDENLVTGHLFLEP